MPPPGSLDRYSSKHLVVLPHKSVLRIAALIQHGLREGSEYALYDWIVALHHYFFMFEDDTQAAGGIDVVRTEDQKARAYERELHIGPQWPPRSTVQVDKTFKPASAQSTTSTDEPPSSANPMEKVLRLADFAIQMRMFPATVANRDRLPRKNMPQWFTLVVGQVKAEPDLVTDASAATIRNKMDTFLPQTFLQVLLALEEKKQGEIVAAQVLNQWVRYLYFKREDLPSLKKGNIVDKGFVPDTAFAKNKLGKREENSPMPAKTAIAKAILDFCFNKTSPVPAITDLRAEAKDLKVNPLLLIAWEEVMEWSHKKEIFVGQADES